MKLDPGFTSHWKTERLIDELGSDGVLALLRLWGKCQINREWKGLRLTPKRLAMETKWKGDENHLFRVFSDPEAAWIDMDEDGTFSLHGFEEHQKQVIHLWEAGKKGGRPKKVSPTPSSKDSSSSSSTYSSSYPICEPNGNHMVSKGQEPNPKSRGTLEEFQAFAKLIGLTESDGDYLHASMLETGWKRGKSPIKDWQATMRKWKSQGWLPSQKNQNNKPQKRGYQENLELP